MKKILPICLLLLVSGCTEKVKETTMQSNFSNDKDGNGTISQDEVIYTDVVIKENEIKLHESAYLLDTVTGDLTGDSKEEEIMLYISPSPFDEETGEAIWWEDLHLWQLIVKDGEKTYPLYSGDTGGKLRFWLSQEPEKKLILVEESMSIYVYEFKYEDRVFKRRVLVDSGAPFKRSEVEW